MVFQSKILLFGEYVLLKDGMGLAIPYPKYSGTLIMPNDETILNHNNLDSNSILKKLAVKISHNHLFSQKSKIGHFLEDALCGLYFESNIPQNYGLGSSGALSASIYKKYFEDDLLDLNNKASLKKLKNELASLESFFHGNSSGTDPLVSYLNKPILLNAPIHINKLVAHKGCKIMLIDTQITSATHTFIEKFNRLVEDPSDTIQQLIKLNNECIAAIANQSSECFKKIKIFSDFEREVLSEMFVLPSGLDEILTNYNSHVAIKLCGSGGGGYIIAFVQNEMFNSFSNELKKGKINFDEFTFPASEIISL